VTPLESVSVSVLLARESKFQRARKSPGSRFGTPLSTELDAAAELVACAPELVGFALVGVRLGVPAGVGLPSGPERLASGSTLLGLVGALPAVAETALGTRLGVALLVSSAALEDVWLLTVSAPELAGEIAVTDAPDGCPQLKAMDDAKHALARAGPNGGGPKVLRDIQPRLAAGAGSGGPGNSTTPQPRGAR
jgi:hypothetical protein